MTYASPTEINATKGFSEVLNYINVVTDNWVSNMMLIGIYIIVLLGFYKAKEDYSALRMQIDSYLSDHKRARKYFNLP